MLLSIQTCGAGWWIIFHLPLGFFVRTSIWLSWLFIRKGFCLFNGKLAKEKPSYTSGTCWPFFNPNANYQQYGGVWHTWFNSQARFERVLKRLNKAMLFFDE